MEPCNVLTPGARRTAWALEENVRQFIDRWGVNAVGFLTLTFVENVEDCKEAQRRFNNLARRALKRYSEWICVLERQRRGAVHYHLLVAVGSDIRRGFDWEAFARRDYRSAGEVLRGEWEFWRGICPEYGFGRAELTPIRKTGDAIARYVGKYVAKHIEQREERDKGARLVRYSLGRQTVKGWRGGAARASTRFAWASVRGWLWRAKLGEWARELGVTELSGFAELFGPRWAYALAPEITRRKLAEYPTAEHALADGVAVRTDNGGHVNAQPAAERCKLLLIKGGSDEYEFSEPAQVHPVLQNWLGAPHCERSEAEPVTLRARSTPSATRSRVGRSLSSGPKPPGRAATGAPFVAAARLAAAAPEGGFWWQRD